MRWQILGIASAVAASVSLVLPAALPMLSLTLPEADTLAAGSLLGTEIRAEEGLLSERLKRGFKGVAKNPRVKQFNAKNRWRGHTIEPPLPRWVSGVAIATFGGGEDADQWSELDRSRWGASIALGLALALLFVSMVLSQRESPEDRRALLFGGWAVVLALCLPGVVEAGASVGYAATLAFASAALVLATGHAARGGSGIWAGVAWGLCLACHPATLFLLVPTIAAVAIGQSYGAQTARPEEAGHVRLPQVALSALAIPVVGAIIVVLVWPSVWNNSMKGLAVWLTDSYRMIEPTQNIAGHTFGQAATKPPSGWAALVQFVGWVPVPLLIAWGAGVMATIKKGASGDWFPILFVVTVLVIAATAGGLFFGRMSLLPLLWVPTAATAVIGIRGLAVWINAWRPELAVRRLEPAVGVIVALTALFVLLSGAYPTGGTSGAEVRQPLPVALIEVLAEETPLQRVSVVGAGSWRRHMEVLTLLGRVPIHYEDNPKRAQWVLVVDEAHVRAATDPKRYEGLPDGEPAHEAKVGGLTFKAYKR